MSIKKDNEEIDCIHKHILYELCRCHSICAELFEKSCDVETNQSKKSVLWYNEPAPNSGSVSRVKSRGFPYDEDWERWSLPIGNGYMGASVFGRTDTERIQLTEKTLGNKGPYNRGGLTSFADIYLDIHHQVPMNYRRVLSLDDAISTVSYEYDGVNYTREYFANYPSNVIVVKLKADKPGKVTFLLRPVLPYLREYNDEKNGRTGTCVCARRFDYHDRGSPVLPSSVQKPKSRCCQVVVG